MLSSFPVLLFWEVGVIIPILLPGNKSLELAHGHAVRNWQSQVVLTKSSLLTLSLAHFPTVVFLYLAGHPCLPTTFVQPFSLLTWTILEATASFPTHSPKWCHQDSKTPCDSFAYPVPWLPGNFRMMCIIWASLWFTLDLSSYFPSRALFSYGLPCIPSLHLLLGWLPLLRKSFLFSWSTTGGGVTCISIVSAPQELYVCLRPSSLVCAPH